MRHGCVLFLGLFFGGCVLEGPTAGLWNRVHPFQGPTGSDVIQLDVAILEAPVADTTLNQQIWKLADELELTPEMQTLVENNGFRVGQIGGMAPKELQNLLTSERSCVYLRRIQLRSGSSRPLLLGPAVSDCQFVLHEPSGERPVTLKKGRFFLSVVPTLTSNSAGGPLEARTQLRFTPEIQTGDEKDHNDEWNTSNHKDGTRQLLGLSALHSPITAPKPSTERYANLAWDISLAPNDYVLIGTCYDRPDTLGWHCFVRTDETTPVQRMLVLRTTRTTPAVEAEVAQNPSLKPPSFSDSPSLAAQASSSGWRGQ
jgi:hypothetical protein